MSEKLIQVEELTKVYGTGDATVHALRGISLQIQPGEFAAVMGPSGSGKSTLMNIIGCMDRPTAGTYVLNKHDVRKLNKNELAAVRNREIGFIFQSYNLLPRMTALKNVLMPLLYSQDKLNDRERKARAIAVLESVGLADRMHHRPNELSGGQQQRVAIARALVNHPSLILADEPTGNLDTKSGEEIMDILQELHTNGATILLVTHEAHIAQYAHRTIRMRDGKIESDERNDKFKSASESNGAEGESQR